MIRKHELNDKWIKASILGTTWAASEIVLGSFLHNLKIPFSSNFLTGIGIIILISSNYIWREKGLFWRAGLICALMKSMSPSAVIFGPMIAIFSESLLMELSIRMLGRTIAGYLLGGMLAMSWNLFHKIINFIIFYGFNIVEVYTNLLNFSQKQLNIHFSIVWMPILILLGLFCIMGLVFAVFGIRVGRKLLKQSSAPIEPKPTLSELSGTKQKPPFNYSVIWLVFNFVLMITGLILISFTPWFLWVSFIIVVVILWISRYKRALHQLLKPKFWIGFAVITMLTAFAFSSMQSLPLMKGIMIGIQMNFRAVLIILGFSVTGTELYNPVIRTFFMKTSFHQLPLALELSFDSLPSMIARIPEFRVLVKNPVSVIYQVLSGIDTRLEEIRAGLSGTTFIIAGKIGQGKTTQVQKIVETLKDNHIPVAGIYSPRIMVEDQTTGYDIVDIVSLKREFLRKLSDSPFEKIGRYSILPDGFKAGKDALQKAESEQFKVIVIDEIGQLELGCKGWADNLDRLFKNSKSHFVLAVREDFTRDVITKWNLSNVRILHLSEFEDSQIRNFVLQLFH